MSVVHHVSQRALQVEVAVVLLVVVLEERTGHGLSAVQLGWEASHHLAGQLLVCVDVELLVAWLGSLMWRL